MSSPIWHPFTQHGLGEPIPTVVRSEGAALFTSDGRRIVDAISSWWVTTHGHREPRIMAAIEGVTIDPERLAMPAVDGPLVVEGAGGVLVPLSGELLYADMFARWGAPVVLVARTALGTINHSLLSIEALRRRGVPILGVAFVGEPVEDSEATIARIGGVKRLGRLARVAPLDAGTLARAFAAGFRTEDFA